MTWINAGALPPGSPPSLREKNGRISCIGEREAKLTAWFGENLEETTLFDLSVA